MNIDEIRVTPARNRSQRTQALRLRARGYSKYFTSPKDAADDLDASPNCLLLVASTASDEIIGTMRILDGARGPIELESFAPLARLGAPEVAARSFAEATRLTVMPGPRSRAVKLALWKAFFVFAMRHRRRGMLVWGRPPAARQDQRLLFEDLGPAFEFVHPLLGSEKNRSLWMDLRQARERLRTTRHPLYDFFFEMHHPKVSVE